MDEGSFVGYGCTYRTMRDSRIAVIPVGYHEGYDRGLSNVGHVLVAGRRAPVHQDAAEVLEFAGERLEQPERVHVTIIVVEYGAGHGRADVRLLALERVVAEHLEGIVAAECLLDRFVGGDTLGQAVLVEVEIIAAVLAQAEVVAGGGLCRWRVSL